jgi:hypothetical protein
MKKVLFVLALAALTGCCKSDCNTYSTPCFKVDCQPSGFKPVECVPQVQQVQTYQPVNVQEPTSNCQCNPCECNPCKC